MVIKLSFCSKHIASSAVLALSTLFAATSVQALDCDDQGQLMQQFDAIAQQSQPLERWEIEQPEDWILGISEYQALQACGNAIYPAAVEFTATAALDTSAGGLFTNNRYFVMSAFWLNHPGRGLGRLLNALGRTESDIEQRNLVEAIQIITSQWSGVRFPSLHHSVGESFLPLLDHPDPWTRILVVRVLTDFAGPPALIAPEIIRAIQQEPQTPSEGLPSEVGSVRASMARDLAWSPAAEFVIPEIIEIVRTSSDPNIYNPLVPALRLWINEDHPDLDRALALLVNMALHDEREFSALPAIVNLGRFGARAQSTIPDLVDGLQQIDDNNARYLAIALVDIGEDLLTNIDDLTPSEVADLAALYERAAKSVIPGATDRQTERLALGRIWLTFRELSN